MLFRSLFFFGRLLQIGNQIAEVAARTLQKTQLNDDARDEISTVIEEIILTECRVPRGFDGERRIFALCTASCRLINDIFVAAFKANVFAAERFVDKFGMPTAVSSALSVTSLHRPARQRAKRHSMSPPLSELRL